MKDNSAFLKRILGSSDGTANQSLSFNILLKDIWILEPSITDKDISKGKNEDVRKATGGKVWVRWHPVDNFLESDEESRHYTIDRDSGQTQFGDGVNGRIPTAGGIIRATYETGSGEEGNVGAEDVSVKTESIGTPEIRAGECVTLRGLGKKFSSTYLIERTTHEISSEGYVTAFRVSVERNNEDDSEETEDCSYELQHFERNNYFYGKLLTVGDFQMEQKYFEEKRRLINRLIHDIGTHRRSASDQTTKKNKKKPCLIAILLNIIKCLGLEIGGEITISVIPNKAVLVKRA